MVRSVASARALAQSVGMPRHRAQARHERRSAPADDVRDIGDCRALARRPIINVVVTLRVTRTDQLFSEAECRPERRAPDLQLGSGKRLGRGRVVARARGGPARPRFLDVFEQ